MNAYAQSADAYLTQRVMGASPEQQAALLMEAGQRHLGKAIKAMEQRDHAAVAHSLDRVAAVITEAAFRLDQEGGGEVAKNLLKMYDWWTNQILEAARTREVAMLRVVSNHMGEIRQAWEQLHEKQVRGTQPPKFHQLGDQVV